MICVNTKGKDHLKVGYVRAVQAFDNKIKVCFEDGTECKLQAANNFEHLEDGKRKRGQGEEDDNNLQKSAAAMKFKANQSEEEKQQAFRNKDVARKREKRKNNNNDYSNDDNNNSNNNNISHISAAS